MHGRIGPSNLFCHVCSESLYVKTDNTVKLLRRKILILKELFIENFMKEYYIPALEKYVYHIHYVHVLSKISLVR